MFRRPEQHQVQLPVDTFLWRGVKGGEVIAFRISPGYVANFAELTGQVKIAIEGADPAIGHTMCFYGVGNHGGGPSKAMIEWIIAHRHSFEGHELVFSTPQAFMDAIADKRDQLPRVSIELQHTFPGCYSVMHDIKSAQRHGEHLLDQAEHAAVAFASDEADRQDSLARIERAWDDLLFTEFHDILTGTSVPSAWRSVRAMQGRARIDAEEVLFEVTRRWSYRVLPRVNEHQIVAINTHDVPFRGFVEAEPYLDFDDWHGRWLSDERGKPVRFQEIQPESNQLIPRILFPAKIAATGACQFQVRSDPPPKNRRALNTITASKRQLSNGLIAISLGAGGISQIAFRGVNLLGRGGIGLQLRHDSTDTWTFHTDRWTEAVEARLGGGAWQVEESGPLRGRVRMDARLRNSRVTWTVSVCEGEPRLEIDLLVNFDERFTLLQMPVRLADQPSRWVDGIAGGHVARSSGPTEWPFLGWSRLSGRQDRHRNGYERCLQSQRERDDSGSRRCCAARRWPGAEAGPSPMPAAIITRTRACTAFDSSSGSLPLSGKATLLLRFAARRSRWSSSIATRAWIARPGDRCRRAASGDQPCCATWPKASFRTRARPNRAASSSGQAPTIQDRTCDGTYFRPTASRG